MDTLEILKEYLLVKKTRLDLFDKNFIGFFNKYMYGENKLSVFKIKKIYKDPQMLKDFDIIRKEITSEQLRVYGEDKQSVLDHLTSAGTSAEDFKCSLSGCDNNKRFFNKVYGFSPCCTIKDTAHKEFLKKHKKNKQEKTSLERYGVTNYAKTTESKNKKLDTNRLKYGCDNVMQNKNIIEKIKHDNYKKYGCWYTQTEEFKSKSKITSLERYDTEHYMASQIGQKKFKETCIKKYGFSNPMHLKTFKEKAKDTNRVKYGCDNVMQNKSIFEKMHQSIKKKYGTEYYSQSDHFRENKEAREEKAKATSLKKYGAEYYSQSDHFRENKEAREEKAKATSLEKYGTEYYSQSDHYHKNNNTVDWQLKQLTRVRIWHEFRQKANDLMDLLEIIEIDPEKYKEINIIAIEKDLSILHIDIEELTNLLLADDIDINVYTDRLIKLNLFNND